MNEQDYIVEAFTKEGEKTNLEVNRLNVSCITSKNNKFELDSEGNLTVKSVSTLNGISVDERILDAMYPIGSIYMSVNNSNPSFLFGGVWEQLKDRFLLGTGDTYQNGTVGGENTHTLTINEMPNHCHQNNRCQNGVFNYDSADKKNAAANADATWWSFGSTTAVGGSQPHNNMPPYLTVYMWKRVA